jgi:tetratricopeptide (TPR) repeat protein
MKGTNSFKRGMSTIRTHIANDKYAEALREVDRLLQDWKDQPALLVLRGELIQLQEKNGPSLEVAAGSLKMATTLDDQNGEAWLELGHYQFAVEDNAKAAEKSFAKAVSTSSETLAAALLGRAGALEEMGRTREAFDCLTIARYLQSTTDLKNGSSAAGESVFERWESLVDNM